MSGAEPMSDREILLRGLPSVDALLQSDTGAEWLQALPRERVTALARDALAEIRAAILAGEQPDGFDGLAAVKTRVTAKLTRLTRPSLRRVINASGVILHTNLGRAPARRLSYRGDPRNGGRIFQPGIRSGRGQGAASATSMPASCSNNFWARRPLSSTTMPRRFCWC